MSAELTTIRTVGGLLPPDVLARVLAADPQLEGLRPADYHLAAGETPREAANRAWSYLTGAWSGYRSALAKLPEGDPAVGLTREKWLMILLGQLGYGRVPVTAARGIDVDGRLFPVSHLWERTPMHLLGWGVDLDKRTKGVPGAAERAPHAMLQELLNRSERYLWGIVSNGRVLRLLRDSTSLSGQAFVEFDLEAMFDGEVFSDFVLLYLLAHQSRFELGEEAPATGCWLERWRTAAIESGTRALGLLRDGVKDAIESLGTGFLKANPDLNERIASGELRLDDYHRSLLRTVYRLLFLFVAEDRGALLSPEADPVARKRYAEYFSTSRLRHLSIRRRGTLHGDLWAGLSVVIDALGREQGRAELGLVGIGGLFDHGPQDVVTGLALSNEALLSAVRRLTVVQPKGQPKRTVDYRNLGAEELGGIYESLLELVPRHQQVERAFILEDLAGNDRKTSGSYYTPSALIDLVLDEALNPVLDEAESATDPALALLAIRVCDPSCGSGHFLVAAARRIAARLATARTGESEVAPADMQQAVHDVVSRCVYGVDLKPLAAELAKVSLWLEAMVPGRPLSFLDSHIKVGNSLLGTTWTAIGQGIPDSAYDFVDGDDKTFAAALKRRNKQERDQGAQGGLFSPAELDNGGRWSRRSEMATESAGTRGLSLADVHLAAQRYREFVDSEERRRARLVADAWCAALVQTKSAEFPALTHDSLTELGREQLRAVQQLSAEFRFFHWEIEFPEIFAPDPVISDRPSPGFSAILGNPPWDQIQRDPLPIASRFLPELVDERDASVRETRIAQLRSENVALDAELSEHERIVDRTKHFIHASGLFPLGAYGRLATASLFLELAEHRRSGRGHIGLVLPLGIATDKYTQRLFSSLLPRLRCLIGFENEEKIFPAVHNTTKFCVLEIGPDVSPTVVLGFFIRRLSEVDSRRFSISREALDRMTPDGALPIFRNPDAARVLAIILAHGVPLKDQGFRQWLMFMSGAELDAATTPSGDRRFALFEGKMIHQFDWRAGTYEAATTAQLNKGTLPSAGARRKDATFEPQPERYLSPEWFEGRLLPELRDKGWMIGWRATTSVNLERSLIAAALPIRPTVDSLPILHTAEDKTALEYLAVLGQLNSLVVDFALRHRISGNALRWHAMSATPVVPVSQLRSLSSPERGVAWLEWVNVRVLELVYCDVWLEPLARQSGDTGAPFVWDEDRRRVVRAELDAGVAILFELTRPDLEVVLDGFPVLQRYEERDFGAFLTRRLVLERYDDLAAAVASGVPYETPIVPPPGQGPRHEPRAEMEANRS